MSDDSKRRTAKEIGTNRKEKIELSNAIDRLVNDGAQFVLLFIKSAWYLSLRRASFFDNFDAKVQHGQIISPTTFLILTAFPGSIYAQAVGNAYFSGALNYTYVAQNFATLLGGEFGATQIVRLCLPVVVATFLLSYGVAWLSRLREPSNFGAIRAAVFYAVGYSSLCIFVANIIPHILLSIIELETEFPGFRISRPMPTWMKLAGVPISVFGILSAGHIVLVAVNEFRDQAIGVIGKLLFFATGVICLYVVLVFVALSNAIDIRDVLRAQVKHNEPDHTNIFCKARSLDVSNDGNYRAYFTIENHSDETLYVRRSGAKIRVESTLKDSDFDINWIKRNIGILSWSDGDLPVLTLEAKQTKWIEILGTMAPPAIPLLRKAQSVPGGAGGLKVIWLSFNSVSHSNYVCLGQDAYIPDKQRPSFFVM